MNSDQNKSFCLGGLYYSQTISQIIYEKVDP